MYSVSCVILAGFFGFLFALIFGMTGLFISIPIAILLGFWGGYMDNRDYFR